MNPEELCEKLKKLIKIMCSQTSKEGVFARVTEEGLYTFGTRKPLTRNTVTKAVAIWIILQKLPTEETFTRTKK
ncbi:MAG: hypothetical protein WC827_03800 [Candidatus Paceibacterota bacterium]|jgi:hypothetical protein